MAKTQNTKGAAQQSPARTRSSRSANARTFHLALVFIQASFNNTIVTITDQIGNTLSWKSSGSLGFRGSRKGPRLPHSRPPSVLPTQPAITASGQSMCASQGPGSGRESAIRALATTGIEVRSIRAGDYAHGTHNGCRPPKRRRV